MSGRMTSKVERPEVERPEVERLRRRSEFVAVARGRRVERSGFVIQAARRNAGSDDAPAAPRFGFTVTKKVGNSVVRNRIRRRLREAVRLGDLAAAMPGHDYVLVGRRAALALPFGQLMADLADGLTHVAAKAGRRRPLADREQPGQANVG